MDIFPTQKIQAHRLLRLGVLLFLLGLITGFAVPAMKNPRMGLSSHMEGVLNGIFLIAIGLLWEKLLLSNRLLHINFWLIIYGTFANWFCILLAAIWGAGLSLPIAAMGMHGVSWQEAVINFLLYSLSLAMVATCVILLYGLRRANRFVE
ncbi:MAG: putative hydroxylaminobenzene mutase [Bacteroidota bacterium]|nr:putative hydroxylaminobenzene mutase [Bacteroidota bacterium]